MKTFTIGLSLAALAVSGAAYAAQDASRPRPDADGNGVVTRAEAQQTATAMFARLDANKDGKLDQSDRAARREDRRSRMFERLDADKNGQISRAEFLAERPLEAQAGKRQAGADRPGGRHGARHGGRQGARGGMMAMARMADTNGNGSIDQAEFTGAALKHFETMDANKDGQVTQQERQAAREQMRAKWQQMRAQKSQG